MYKIPQFTEPNASLVTDFMRAHPFATIIGNNAAESVATQVPVLLENRNGVWLLKGHIMRKTDHHLAFEQNPDVLILFQGPQCYVSASWYSERGHGSTWNYMTVHVRGKISFMDEAGTVDVLKQLTHYFEDGRPQPELLENMTDEYVHGNVKAITGFEIPVQSIQPIFKLSQNRDDVSYKAIVKQLSSQSDEQAKAIATEMKKRRAGLFE